MKIDAIYISCYTGDIHLTRPCVASIRRWYPDIPITLVKDELHGKFSTRDLERQWDVSVMDTGRNQYGTGFTKLEPLFVEERKRIFVMDSDIVFCGRVLDELASLDAEFIVSGFPRDGIDPAEIDFLYFKCDQIHSFDAEFQIPDYFFNTGQFVATTGIFKKSDFDELAIWEPKAVEAKHPEIFRLNDQGVLNYYLHKQHQQGRITLASHDFMMWPKSQRAAAVSLSDLEGDGIPFLFHWAGLRKPRTSQIVRSEFIDFFNREYFGGNTQGILRRKLNDLKGAWTNYRIQIPMTVLRRLAKLLKPLRKARISTP